jgi:hypothetical protein
MVRIKTSTDEFYNYGKSNARRHKSRQQKEVSSYSQTHPNRSYIASIALLQQRRAKEQLYSAIRASQFVWNGPF